MQRTSERDWQRYDEQRGDYYGYDENERRTIGRGQESGRRGNAEQRTADSYAEYGRPDAGYRQGNDREWGVGTHAGEYARPQGNYGGNRGWGSERYMGPGSERGYGQEGSYDHGTGAGFRQMREDERRYMQTHPYSQSGGGSQRYGSSGAYDQGSAYERGSGRQFQGDYGYGYGEQRFGNRGNGGRGYGGGSGAEEMYGAGGDIGVATGWAAPQRRHHGVGPKGYVRSDERLKEEVSDSLMASGELDASEIEVEVSGGEVTLKGSVCCRGDKFAAEQLAESVMGVKDIQNHLRINRSGGSQAQEKSGAGSSGRESADAATRRTGATR